ncbi:MAG: OmpA family protein [Flavipsychrobacter sp.]|nr:OmpA family protein [Flavipsychrobacter sp.]
MKYIYTFAALLLALSANAQSYKLSGNDLVLEKPVTFQTGTAELTPEGREILAGIKKYLEDKTYISLMRIEGHVAGSADDQALSEKRAIAAGKWLTDNGVDCKRLIMVGFGSTKPVANDNPANTRIVFSNAELRGHLIGSMPADGGGKVAKDRCP